MSSMSKFLVLISILIFSIQVIFADNPIISQKYTADPSALVYNGRVYVYCSHDDPNNESYDMFDYTLVSSDDMVNWTDHGEVFEVPRDASWASLAYAPSCIIRNNKFYLYFPDGGNSIGVAVADKPEGPFVDPLGKSLVNRSMPNCDVQWCFDPAAFIDDNGQAYLYFGGGSDNVGYNLRVIKLNDDMISVDGGAISIDAPSSFEASYMHKYGGKYYFSYATDGASKIDYMMSDSPTSGFQHKGTVLPNPSIGGQNINGHNNNHASIVQYLDQWYMFYHDRRLSDEVYFRNASVDLLYYNTDGTLKEVTVTNESVPQLKYLNAFDTLQAETMDRQQGIKTDATGEGRRMVVSTQDGDWVRYTGVDFGEGAEIFEARVSNGSPGGSIELHLGSSGGELAGTCEVQENSWTTVQCNVQNCSGVKDLYMVFKGQGNLCYVDWFRFSASIVISYYNPKQSPSVRQNLLENGIGSTKILKIFDITGRLVAAPKTTEDVTLFLKKYTKTGSQVYIIVIEDYMGNLQRKTIRRIVQIGN